MEGGAITQLVQSVTHFRKNQLRFVSQRKKRFGAAELFALTRHTQYFIGSHCVRSRLAGIAPKGAVAAIIAAQIRERNKDLARVSNYARPEPITGGAGTGKQI